MEVGVWRYGGVEVGVWRCGGGGMEEGGGVWKVITLFFGK